MGISIDKDTCENSGVCLQVCPEDVFAEEDGHIVVINPRNCTNCWICVENCASGAIEID